MTHELSDPAEGLQTEPHLEDLAAKQVFLSVEVRDYVRNLCRCKSTKHGDDARDQVALDVEAADDEPADNRSTSDELSFNQVGLLMREISQSNAIAVFPADLDVFDRGRTVERAE